MGKQCLAYLLSKKDRVSHVENDFLELGQIPIHFAWEGEEREGKVEERRRRGDVVIATK